MNIRFRSVLVGLAILALGLLGACADDPVAPSTTGLQLAASVDEPAVVLGADFTEYSGVIGGQNLYSILVPSDWNGELVLYAHGFVDAAEPLRIPDKDNVDILRDQLVQMGYAFAYCSFRENGFAVKDGAWSVRQVHQIFRSKVKVAPQYTWLMGQSLGGLVAVELAEKHPREYDGVVSAAGMIGGSQAEIDYMGDVRVLFDLFYPGVLPGSVCEPALITDPNSEVIGPVVAAVTADPNGLGAISRLIPLPGTDANQLVQSLITAILFNYRGLPDLLERTHGECAYDNCDRTYEPRWPGALPPEVVYFVNQSVPRYCRTIPVDELLEREYEPSGRLAVPMITVHLANDPIVPAFHEQLFAEKVAAAGASELLEQRIVQGYGHTLEIDPQEILDAFTDLRAQVLPASMTVTAP